MMKVSKTTKSATSEKKNQNAEAAEIKKVKIPAELSSLENKSFKLKSLATDYAVIFFYPKDSTPGCTIEANEFSALSSDFKKHNTTVLGVSKDSLKSHENFKVKQKLKIDLISDPNEEACKAFDVIKEKNMYGRKYLGIERSTFVVDTSGKVLKSCRKVSPKGHAAEVLSFVKTLILK